MTGELESFSRYLPPDKQSRHWGWRLLDAGRQSIPPQAPYPVPGHPLGYLFGKAGKRTLDEFQIIFITAGNGTFESKSAPLTTVGSGDALLLFPHEWHRYRPDPETGWNEYWLGFRGQDAERVMGTFFDPASPIRHPAQTDEIIRLFEQMLHWLKNPVAGIEQVLASHVPLILAFLQSGSLHQGTSGMDDSQLVQVAKSRILQNISSRTDLADLARSLGISYSKFRALFKEQTGYSPREFENLIKLNRARDLLQSGNYSVSSTADALGYTSVYYFSRAFKRQFGQSPRNWLNQSM
ncbi:MAG: helix-turn-helix domain-containing protein [Puniceicoccaceae bacterium]